MPRRVDLRVAAFAVACICAAPVPVIAQGTILASSITLVNPGTATKAQSQYDSTLSVAGTMSVAGTCGGSGCSLKLISLGAGLAYRVTNVNGSTCGGPTSPTFGTTTAVVLASGNKDKTCTVTIDFHITGFSYADYQSGVAHAFNVGFQITSP